MRLDEQLCEPVICIYVAPAAMYVDCRGIVACVDLRLHAWLSYQPSPREPLSSETDAGMAVNANIANATLPLMQRSPLGKLHQIMLKLCYTTKPFMLRWDFHHLEGSVM